MKKAKQGQQGEKPAKKGKKKWIVIGVVVVILLAAVIGGGNDDANDADSSEAVTSSAADTNEAQTDAAADTSEAQTDAAEGAEYTLEHGELVSVVTNEIDGKNVIVIKAKISSSYDNEATVDQSYYNVEDLIQNQGCDEFDELQYWAVADMSDGAESKVVSFTVDAELIQKIAAKSVVANQLGDYVADLYIHPSLSE